MPKLDIIHFYFKILKHYRTSSPKVAKNFYWDSFSHTCGNVFKNPKILSHIGLLPLSSFKFGHELKAKVATISLSILHLFIYFFSFSFLV